MLTTARAGIGVEGGTPIPPGLVVDEARLALAGNSLSTWLLALPWRLKSQQRLQSLPAQARTSRRRSASQPLMRFQPP